MHLSLRLDATLHCSLIPVSHYMYGLKYALSLKKSIKFACELNECCSGSISRKVSAVEKTTTTPTNHTLFSTKKLSSAFKLMLSSSHKELLLKQSQNHHLHILKHCMKMTKPHQLHEPEKSCLHPLTLSHCHVSLSLLICHVWLFRLQTPMTPPQWCFGEDEDWNPSLYTKERVWSWHFCYLH